MITCFFLSDIFISDNRAISMIIVYYLLHLLTCYDMAFLQYMYPLIFCLDITYVWRIYRLYINVHMYVLLDGKLFHCRIIFILLLYDWITKIDV